MNRSRCSHCLHHVTTSEKTHYCSVSHPSFAQQGVGCQVFHLRAEGQLQTVGPEQGRYPWGADVVE